MTNYSRGRAFEYRVQHHLEDKGFYVIRSAGSHSEVDLVAFNGGEHWFIQCKADGVISKAEIRSLVALADELQVMPFLASKVNGKIELKVLK